MPGEKKAERRTRTLQVRVTEAEDGIIREKMQQAGIVNLSAFVRKMVLDGYVVHLDFPELKKLMGLLGRCGNNLNQIAHKANATGSLLQDDIAMLQEQQAELIDLVTTMLVQLGKLI